MTIIRIQVGIESSLGEISIGTENITEDREAWVSQIDNAFSYKNFCDNPTNYNKYKEVVSAIHGSICLELNKLIEKYNNIIQDFIHAHSKDNLMQEIFDVVFKPTNLAFMISKILVKGDRLQTEITFNIIYNTMPLQPITEIINFTIV